MAEDINPEAQETPEVEKPKKKKKSDKMSMPAIIGIIAGVILLQVVLIMVVVQVFFSTGESEEKSENAGNSEVVDTEEAEPAEEDGEERDFFTDDSNKLYLETGKIVTNPKLSSKYVAVNVGLIYIPKESVEAEDLAESSPMMMKLLAEVKSKIIMTIGSMLPEELQENRDLMPEIFREELKPIFKEKDIYLREVLISEYIMQ